MSDGIAAVDEMLVEAREIARRNPALADSIPPYAAAPEKRSSLVRKAAAERTAMLQRAYGALIRVDEPTAEQLEQLASVAGELHIDFESIDADVSAISQVARLENQMVEPPTEEDIAEYHRQVGEINREGAAAVCQVWAKVLGLKDILGHQNILNWACRSKTDIRWTAQHDESVALESAIDQLAYIKIEATNFIEIAKAKISELPSPNRVIRENEMRQTQIDDLKTRHPLAFAFVPERTMETTDAAAVEPEMATAETQQSD